MTLKIAISAVLLAYAFTANAGNAITLELRWAGIYSVSRSQQIDDPTSPTGKRTKISQSRLERETSQIPARLGTRFGVSYVFRGAAEGHAVKHRVIWRFPSVGLSNPETKRITHEAEWDQTCPAGAECLAGQRFVQSWELIQTH